MTKQHPDSVLLIERSNGLWWRIAARKTTQTGLDHEIIYEEDHFQNYTDARSRFNTIKATTAALFILLGSVLTSRADPPEPGSKQWDRMAPYGDFISSMHDKNGSNCCNVSDGRMGDGGEELKEFQETDKDGNITYYVYVERKIFDEDSSNSETNFPVSHSYDRAIPPEGKIFKIPPDHVLTIENNDVKRCLNKNNNTCTAPENNVLWLSTGGDVYCYWPVQHWTQQRSLKYALGD